MSHYQRGCLRSSYLICGRGVYPSDMRVQGRRSTCEIQKLPLCALEDHSPVKLSDRGHIYTGHPHGTGESGHTLSIPTRLPPFGTPRMVPVYCG